MGLTYEFTNETMKYKGHLLHRIKRLSDGELGGWIEKEENLSQEGCCWIKNSAKVYDDAKVYGNAIIKGDANVYGNAKVFGDAIVGGYGDTRVYGNAQVYGNAIVHGNVWLYGNAQIYDNAKVYYNARIFGNAQISGNAIVSDSACVFGEAQVNGIALICDEAKVYGNTKIVSGKYFANGTSNEVIQNFIYKIDDSNKITTHTEYNSIDEFFKEPIKNDIKLDTLVICTVDTKIPLIKLEKIETENKLNYRFIVDISIDNGDNFSIKSTIETQEQLNQKLEQTIEALKQYPEFSKYADDLEYCL